MMTLPTHKTLTIGIVAGEVSGDALGADFMHKMNALHNVRWVGVGGNAMIQAGLETIFDINRLAVMGLVEVIKHLPDLLAAKKEILSVFGRENIDIFIGIDAPDFNLRISKALKQQSLLKPVFCVQYVSPSIWAWRENRIHAIKKATDLVLCLFPFELSVYNKHHHPAVCVGHPLLHQLDPSPLTQTENYQLFLQMFAKELGDLPAPISTTARPICVMAGSRMSEIQAMLDTMIQTMQQLEMHGDFCYIMPVVNQAHTKFIQNALHTKAPSLLNKTHILFNPNKTAPTISQYAMNACQLVLLASGTATFEALLLHRPMVVIYKVSPLTYLFAKQLVKIPYYALPNILSHNQTGLPIVPELIQSNANAAAISQNVLDVLSNIDDQQAKLKQTTQTLKKDSHTNPAQAVLTAFLKNQTTQTTNPPH